MGLDTSEMNIKKLLLSLLLLVAAATGARADTYFQYPIVPDSIETLQGRCNYLARHFFDFCDLGKAFSNRARMGEEFNVYISVTSGADPDVAEREARALMKKLDKQPADQLYLAEIAEGRLYSDTAQVWLDRLYLPYAEAVAANRRTGKAEKARFVQQATQLRNSMIGYPIAPIEYQRPDGTKGNLLADSAEVTVVFFNDPDCPDCDMARLRLAADISTSELVAEGKMKIVSLSLTEPDARWREFVAQMPDSWAKGASPDADLTIDLRGGTPEFYVLGRGGKIRFKHLDIDQLLDVSRQLKKR